MDQRNKMEASSFFPSDCKVESEFSWISGDKFELARKSRCLEALAAVRLI